LKLLINHAKHYSSNQSQVLP